MMGKEGRRMMGKEGLNIMGTKQKAWRAKREDERYINTEETEWIK
jgi:hypothetical protein